MTDLFYETSGHPDDGVLIYLRDPEAVGGRQFLGNVPLDDPEDARGVMAAIDKAGSIPRIAKCLVQSLRDRDLGAFSVFDKDHEASPRFGVVVSDDRELSLALVRLFEAYDTNDCLTADELLAAAYDDRQRAGGA
ncbi:MAG: hypothetical protein AAGI91_12905 [Bacteroidota bacterium]